MSIKDKTDQELSEIVDAISSEIRKRRSQRRKAEIKSNRNRFHEIVKDVPWGIQLVDDKLRLCTWYDYPEEHGAVQKFLNQVFDHSIREVEDFVQLPSFYRDSTLINGPRMYMRGNDEAYIDFPHYPNLGAFVKSFGLKIVYADKARIQDKIDSLQEILQVMKESTEPANTKPTSPGPSASKKPKSRWKWPFGGGW